MVRIVGGRLFRVAGLYRSGISLEDGGVVLPLATAQALSCHPGEVSMVAVAISPGYREADLERAIERALPGTLALGDPGEVARVYTNSRIISKAARTEVGVLAATGMEPVRIVRLILGETMAIRLAGAVVGIGSGVLASGLIVRALAASTFVSFYVSPWLLARGMFVGFALGVIGAVLRLAGPPRAAREGDQPIMRRSAGRSRGSRPAENAPGGHAAVGVILTASFLTSFGSGIVTSMTPLCVLALMSLAVTPLGNVIEREKEP